MNYGIREMVELEMKELAAINGLSLSRPDDLPLIAHLFYETSYDNNIEWLIDGTMYLAWEAVENITSPEKCCQILDILDAQYKCARTGVNTKPRNLPQLFARAQKVWKTNQDFVLQHILETCEKLALPANSLTIQEFFSFTDISQMLVDESQSELGMNFPGDIAFKFDTAMYLYRESMRFKLAAACRIVRRDCMLMWEDDHNPPTCSVMTESEQRRELSRGFMVEQVTEALQKARS